MIRVVKRRLVRGIPWHTVVHLPMSSFTDLLWATSFGLMFYIEKSTVTF